MLKNFVEDLDYSFRLYRKRELFQARAKLELREEATLSDAQEVIELINWSMIDTYSDESGTLDFQRSQHGSGISSRNQVIWLD